MKTLLNGYFYIPDLEVNTLKVELLFDDPALEGDQVGESSPYTTITRWPDGIKNVLDLNFVSNSDWYGTGESYWIENGLYEAYLADVNADKVVNTLDLLQVSKEPYGVEGSYITDLTGVTIEFDNGTVSEPDEDGYVSIPEGATSFYVKKNGAEIGALISFFKLPILTLNVDKTVGYVGDPFTFSGTLTSNGSPVSGSTVTLYKNSDAVGSDITDENGAYSIIWIADSVGEFNFYTKAQV